MSALRRPSGREAPSLAAIDPYDLPDPPPKKSSHPRPRLDANDELTGLSHRHALLHDLADELELAHSRDAGTSALLVLGLDRFKAVNGSLGYRTGDRVLVEAARRLACGARAHDLVARLGGDELAILFTSLRHVSEAQRLASEVQQRLRWPMRLSGRRISVTASLGLVWIDERYTHADEILRDAEIAMSRAKAGGRARCELFDAGRDGADVERLEVETDLHGAFERGELRLHYQPIVDLAGGRLHGFEALVRWQHPRRGLLRPRDFIASAAAVGLMPRVCQWTLEHACRQLAEWQDRFPDQPRPWTMSVNIDSQHLTDPSFVEQVSRTLAESRLAPGHLVLEVTETAMMSTSPRATAVLHELTQTGIALHIDDFGTGYATLSYLHRVPSRALKIDASFVTAMLDDDRHREIVRSIVSLAHKLDLEVIAEGIETPLHLEALAALGCDHGQGFYFSRPLDPESLAALLADETLWIEDVTMNGRPVRRPLAASGRFGGQSTSQRGC